jgi:hypothetical protein
MRFVDLTGRKFGKLTAWWPAGRRGKRGPMIQWLCSCECGNLSVVSVGNLTSGGSKSCGCYSRKMRKTCNLKHGKCRTPEYVMFLMAKTRAKAKHLPFDIEVSDVVIPERCPMLGIPLFQANGVIHDNSPTLDRREPLRGYVRGNVRVISYKANRAKNNLTLDEMKLMVANW